MEMCSFTISFRNFADVNVFLRLCVLGVQGMAAAVVDEEKRKKTYALDRSATGVMERGRAACARAASMRMLGAHMQS
jgi:hypothetical protein